MDNPYAAPQSDAGDGNLLPVEQPRGPGWVKHIRIVAILMMIQGVLELIMGVFMTGFAFFMPTVMQAAAAQQGAPQQSDSATWFIVGIYLSIGIIAFVGGILLITAGIRNFLFRSRTLGIVSLFFSFTSIMTCYCFPSAIGIAIYGLIVYFNYEVSVAFQMRKEGREVNDILSQFTTGTAPTQYYQ